MLLLTCLHCMLFLFFSPYCIDEISAFIWDSARLEWEAAKDCDLITAAEQFGRSGCGVGLQKNSFWTEQMNIAILSMHESGFMTDLDNKWILSEDNDMCLNRYDPVPTTLGLRNMAGVFILLGAGIFGGIALIVIEVVYKKRQVAQQRHLDSARFAVEKWKRFVEVSISNLQGHGAIEKFSLELCEI